MSLHKKAARVLDGAMEGLAIVAASLIVFIVLAISYEIVLRNVFNRSSIWTVEITSYSLLYITFLGAAWLLRREGHVSMDMLVRRLNPSGQHLLILANSIIGAIICLTITWFSVRSTWESFQLGYFLNTELRPPQFPILMVIPLGSFLLFIQFLRRGYGYFGQWRALRSSDNSPVREIEAVK